MEVEVKKILVGLTLAFTLAIAGPASADPQTPCANGNPTDLCGPDLSVEVATPEECEAGGWVVVLNGVRYPFCNGVAGTDGTDGADGNDGATGEVGAAGATGDAGAAGTDGLNGLSAIGAAGATGADGVTTVTNNTNTCFSTRIAKLRLSTKRGNVITNLTAKLHGKKLKLNKRGSRRWTAKVPLTGLPQGVWAVQVRYRANGVLKHRVHLYRTCYSTDTNQTGLNARAAVRL